MPKVQEGLYALYLRKSRADLEKEAFGELETLARHESELTALAARGGYVLDKPYYKELVSGEHISERLEFQRMMAKVEKGVYKGIFVFAVARLGRGDPMEYGWVLNVLKRTRTLVITPTRIFDPRDPDDLRYLQFEMFMSNMELGNIVGRLQGGCRISAHDGCFIKPRAPYGYDRARIDGNWTLVPNDDAPTVRLIFERAADRVPLGTIARDLNESGSRTQSGGFWGASRLCSIIQNPHYKGMIRYGYYKREHVPVDAFTTKVVQSYAKEGEYILVKGLHEPIVSEELWQAANDRNNGTPPVKRSKELQNPLAGLLVCAKCGRALRRFINTCKSNGNKLEHYRHAPFCDCKCRGASMKVVVGAVADALSSVAADLEAKLTVGDTDTKAVELQSIEKQLAREERTVEKLLELYYADAITIDEFKERRQRSDEAKVSLAARREVLLLETEPPRELAFTVREAIALLEDDSVSAQAKNEALRTFVKRIEYENFTQHINQQDIRLHIVLK